MLSYVGDFVNEDELKAILDAWDGDVVDFGGGVMDILLDDFVSEVGNSYVKWAKKTKIRRKRMKEIIERCNDVAGFGRVYREEA